MSSGPVATDGVGAAATASYGRRVTSRDQRSVVLHVDADAFFASVEQLDAPRLAGLPVLVGGTGGRGVVASASREAKRLGARSAMPMGAARRLCGPHHVIVSPRFARYQEVSAAMVAVFERHAEMVEPLSIDEAWLALPPDVDPDGVAAAIRRDVRGTVGITVSVGAATTMVCAKMLSTWVKVERGPGSQAWLGGAAAEREWMAAQPVRSLPGVGPVTASTLADEELDTIGELAAADPARLERVLGTAAARTLQAFARNEDDRRPGPPAERKQLSTERTLANDLATTAAVVALAVELAGEVAADLRERGGGARTVTVKLRAHDFEDVSRSRTLPAPTDEPERLRAVARSLADVAHEALGGAPVRLVGVAVSGLADATQPTLSLD